MSSTFDDGRGVLAFVGEHLPAWRWLVVIGRHPIAFYFGHLVVLDFMAFLIQGGVTL